MKQLFLSLAVVLFCLSANTQEIKLGPKMGINFGKQTGDLQDPSGISGLRGGGFVNIGITDHFSVEPQLLYSAMGSENLQDQRFSIPNTGNFTFIFEADNYTSYLTLPVLAQLDFYHGDSVRVYGNVGPYFSFLLDSRVKYTIDAAIQASNQDTAVNFDTVINRNFKDRFQDFDVGLTFGAGISFSVGEGELTIDFLYNLGLLNVANENYIVPSKELEISKIANDAATNSGLVSAIVNGDLKDYEPEYDAKIQNEAFSIMIGYAFPL